MNLFLSLIIWKKKKSIHKARNINKLNMQLTWINKLLGINKTDDLGCTSHQRHYRLIIQAHYFTSVLNATHSDNFMKFARIKSMKYEWSSHHSLHNELAYLRIDTFTLGKTCKTDDIHTLLSWLSSACLPAICSVKVSKSSQLSWSRQEENSMTDINCL